MVNSRRILIFIFGLLFSSSLWASVTAEVDRTQVHEGDTLMLTINVSGDDNGEPDLTILDPLFDVVSNSQSNSFSYINGQMESHKSWMVTLQPKHAGRIEIPAIEVGNKKTAPIEIAVTPQSAAPSADDSEDIFLQTEIDPKESAYVQSQIIFTLRIFYATALQSGRLSDLTLDNAMVEKLGDDRSYQSMHNGRRYNVIERRYAIFPQNSGTLEIPGLNFSGSIRVAPTRRRTDPFFDPFGALAQSSQQVHLRSKPLTLDIKPRPAHSSGQWWLPARDFRIAEKWSQNPPQFRVGEPITRTILMEAKGLSSAQLPELPLPQLDAIKTYPDQPVTENKTQGDLIIGSRQEKVAFVPTKPGRYTLPPIEIHWWDIDQDQDRVATLPAQTVEVLPAAQTAQSGATAPPAVTEKETREKEAPPSSATTGTTTISPGYWPWLAALFALLWLATLLAWWAQKLRSPESAARNSGPSKETPNPAAAIKALKRACHDNDARAARDALLQWGAALRPQNPPRTLGLIAQLLASNESRQAIDDLDRHLYTGSTTQWVGNVCWQAIAPQLKQATTTGPAKDKTGIAALYPQHS